MMNRARSPQNRVGRLLTMSFAIARSVASFQPRPAQRATTVASVPTLRSMSAAKHADAPCNAAVAVRAKELFVTSPEEPAAVDNEATVSTFAISRSSLSAASIEGDWRSNASVKFWIDQQVRDGIRRGYANWYGHVRICPGGGGAS
jgi:hypothetical protein